MKQPTEQEWQEALEWCGLIKKKATNGQLHYFDSKLEIVSPTDNKGIPIIDPNSLFRYAVPKVLEEHTLIETYSFKQASGLYYSETTIWDKEYRDSDTVGVLKGKLISKAFTQEFDLELANTLSIFWAIKQMLESEKNAKGN